MELIAYTVVAGYVILLAVCGYLRLQIERLREAQLRLYGRVIALELLDLVEDDEEAF